MPVLGRQLATPLSWAARSAVDAIEFVDEGRLRWPFIAGDWRTARAVVALAPPLLFPAVTFDLRFDFLAGGVMALSSNVVSKFISTGEIVSGGSGRVGRYIDRCWGGKDCGYG